MDELITLLSAADPAWLPGDASILLFGRLQLGLNLRGLTFPAQLSEDQRGVLLPSLQQRLWPAELPAHKARLKGLGDSHWEFLSERWLLEPLELRHDDARLLVDRDERRSWLLLAEDHLRLDWRGDEAGLRAGAQELDQTAARLEAEPGLALGPGGERLTANPFLCGSGCHVTLVLHLPALAWWGQVEDSLDPLYERGLSYRTWQEGFGDFLVLENVRGEDWPDPAGRAAGPAQATLERLLAAVAELDHLEQAAREQLRRHRRLELEDKLHRALAACRSARLLGYPELVEHLSLLRLGAQLPAAGWNLPELPVPVTPLLLRLAPAHLAARSDAGLGGKQASALRARLLRATLAG
ncbi:MAG: hypothetical protein WC326_07805 [Candidatus Delongbacteria bacterium]